MTVATARNPREGRTDEGSCPSHRLCWCGSCFATSISIWLNRFHAAPTYHIIWTMAIIRYRSPPKSSICDLRILQFQLACELGPSNCSNHKLPNHPLPCQNTLILSTFFSLQVFHSRETSVLYDLYHTFLQDDRNYGFDFFHDGRTCRHVLTNCSHVRQLHQMFYSTSIGDRWVVVV